MSSPQTTLVNTDAPASGRGMWLWGALLVALYLVSAWLTWGRTLIVTEVWALFYAGKPFWEHMEAVRLDLVHPPLMYFLHRVWIGVFGSNDNAVKVLPLVINIPALLLFVAAAKRMTKHWRAASLGFCTLYVAARVPATTRMYGLGLLLAIGAIHFWNRWRERPTNGRLLAWCAAMVLLVYTHFFGLLLLAGFAVAACLGGPRRRAFLTASVAAGASWLPWLLYVLPVYRERGVETNLWWVSIFNNNPVIALLTLPAALLGDLSAGRLPQRFVYLAAIAVHVCLFAAAMFYVRGNLWRLASPPTPVDRIRALLVITAVPVLVMFAFSVFRTSALNIRFLLGIVPFYWLLIGTLAEAGRRPGQVMLYILVLPWAFVSAGQSLRMLSRPAGVHLAAERIAAAAQSGDHIFSSAGLCNSFYWEWKHRLGRTPEGFECLADESDTKRPNQIQERGLEQTSRLCILPRQPIAQVDVQGHRRVWIVASEAAIIARAGQRIQSLGYRRDFEGRNGAVVVERFAAPDTSGP